MLLLVLDVTNHCAELRTGIGERAESLLPRKPARRPALLIDEARRVRLNVPHELGERGIGSQADQQMQMIRQIVYRNQFVLLSRDDAGDVFLKFIIVFRGDKALRSSTANTTWM